MARNKKVDFNGEDIVLSLTNKGNELLKVKLNNFESGSELNFTMNSLIKVLGGALISASLTILANTNEEPSPENLERVLEKLSNKFFQDTVDSMTDSIKAVLKDNIGKFSKRPSNDESGKA